MTIRPFKAVRPAQEFAARVAALPYDVMSTAEAREMVKDNPYSFLHVDKSEIDLPEGTDIYADAVYDKAAENLRKMIYDKVMVTENAPLLYVYRLVMDSRAQTGLVCCVPVAEYQNGTIKRHELTRADKEADRTRHIEVTNAHTGPIFMTYRDTEGAADFLANICESVPLYDFTSDDGVHHTVWAAEKPGDIAALQEIFRAVPNLYIADGHHRNASAANVAIKRGETPETSEAGFYLAVLFPHSELKILPYNRVVKDLNGLSPDEFLAKLSDSFAVEKVYGTTFVPTERHTFGLYLGGHWYALKAKDAPTDAVDALDVSILQNEALSKILNIQDPRTDKRVDFIGGIRGTDELAALVNSGEWAAAFSMFPTDVSEMMAIADEGRLMPPKSTWFEPKLRSGLFVHMLS